MNKQIFIDFHAEEGEKRKSFGGIRIKFWGNKLCGNNIKKENNKKKMIKKENKK